MGWRYAWVTTTFMWFCNRVFTTLINLKQIGEISQGLTRSIYHWFQRYLYFFVNYCCHDQYFIILLVRIFVNKKSKFSLHLVYYLVATPYILFFLYLLCNIFSSMRWFCIIEIFISNALIYLWIILNSCVVAFENSKLGFNPIPAFPFSDVITLLDAIGFSRVTCCNN